MTEEMKSIITILLICVVSFSARAQCNLKISMHPCEDIVTRSLNYENVCSKPCVLRLKIEQNITNKDTSTSLYIFLTPSFKSCFGKESRIVMKSGNDVIVLPFAGQITCKNEGEKLINYAEMNKGNLSFLKEHTISTIRVYYANSYDDFIIKKQDYFIRNLKCF